MAFHLREPNESDIPALARLHVQTFNETHRGGRTGGPSYELRERQWREAFERQDGSWFCYVIEDDGGGPRAASSLRTRASVHGARCDVHVALR